MVYPICPINHIGIRHSVICSDGYMYEEKCLKEWLQMNAYSPVSRTNIWFVKPCDLNEKCLNAFGDGVEDDYERSNFSLKIENIIDFYYRILNLDITEVDDCVFYNRKLMRELININTYVSLFGSDELDDDREVIIKEYKLEGVITFDLKDEIGKYGVNKLRIEMDGVVNLVGLEDDEKNIDCIKSIEDFRTFLNLNTKKFKRQPPNEFNQMLPYYVV